MHCLTVAEKDVDMGLCQYVDLCFHVLSLPCVFLACHVIVVLHVCHSERLFKNRCTLLNQPSTFRNELCMLVAYLSYCLFITILSFMHRELVKELTLAVQTTYPEMLL